MIYISYLYTYDYICMSKEFHTYFRYILDNIDEFPHNLPISCPLTDILRLCEASGRCFAHSEGLVLWCQVSYLTMLWEENFLMPHVEKLSRKNLEALDIAEINFQY